ncbi:biotin/lipoate A/B protein ligase family protein [Paenibacillus sp. GCM10027626]|uniref:lipoate--protein ligase family protein n=1 Tax=Paenibacillus sp. GCM10027626 TaxID=3273411 RepID=UPI00362B2488
MNKYIPAPFYIQNSSERTLRGDILFPFAYDELICSGVAKGAAPFVHIWRHEKAIVLGPRDRRLPYAERAMEWMRLQGYAVGVRNSGGAAVPLDPGVVNLSVIAPNPEGRLDFKHEFELMYELITQTLDKLGIKVDKGEVVGSYCPGEYDVSVNGRKVCGISQRRQMKAFIVNSFVNVGGHVRRNAELIRNWYSIATGAAEGHEPDETVLSSVPEIKPEVMATLGELGEAGITVRSFTQSLIATLTEWGGAEGRHPDKPSMQQLDQMARLLRERYDNNDNAPE